MKEMRLKGIKKENKTSSIGLRTSEEVKNMLQTKANLYTDGNLSEWIIYAALNYVPSKKELEKK